MSKYSFKIDIKGVRQNILQADWMQKHIDEVAMVEQEQTPT